MQTVIGRLTADAKVYETKDGRKVVHFSIAQNDRYKVKGEDDFRKVVNYFNCSYWMGSSIAAHLKKGMLVETAGRVGVNAWQNASGEAKAGLTMHVQFIQLHSSAKETENTATPTAKPKNDDLPF